MRTSIRTVVAAGALTAAGLGVLAPAAIAATSSDTTLAAAVASRVDRISDSLKGLVTDGTLTQAQADRVAATLAESLPGRGPDGHGGHGSPGGHGGHGGPGGHGGHGHGGRGGFSLSDAATAIGIPEEELRTQLEAGRTLAQVANAEGTTRADLITELVAAGKARLAEEVATGELTQAQADEKAARLPERVTERVDSTRVGGRGHGGPRGQAPSTKTPSAGTTGPAGSTGTA